MSSRVFNVSYSGFGLGELTGYAYQLDFETLAASSAQTWGLRFKGSRPVGGVKALYTAEYATQSDYRDNPSNFRVKYLRLEARLALQHVDFNLGYEVLGSNATVALQTPLATLHAMCGGHRQALALGRSEVLARISRTNAG